MSFGRRVTIFSFILTVLVVWIHAVNAGLSGLDMGVINSISDQASAEELLSAVTGADTFITAFGIKACFYIQRILGSGLGQIAVPGFFAMSGYLFFRNADLYVRDRDMREVTVILKENAEGNTTNDNGNASQYKQRTAGLDAGYFIVKYKKRIGSLVLPFVIWNFIYYIIYIIIGKADTGLSALIQAVAFNRYNPVFWYLRELIILTALTPIIYLLLRTRYAVIPVLLSGFMAAVFYYDLPFHIVNEDALFYYMTGCAAALHIKRYIEADSTEEWRQALIISMLLFAAFEYVYIKCAGNLHLVLTGAVGGRAAGYSMIFSAVSLLTLKSCSKSMTPGNAAAASEYQQNESKPVSEIPDKKNKAQANKIPGFMSFNFFVYALHYLEIRFFRAVFSVLEADFAVTESFGFILMPVLCIAAAVLAGSIMKRCMPRIYSILTGGRG